MRTSRRVFAPFSALLLLSVAASSPARADPDVLAPHVAAALQAISPPDCPTAPVASLSLPDLRASLAASQELMIVALGSSSTQGWMSSNAAHSYPAVLQSELAQALPDAHVVAVNRGIGGQDAPEESRRLERDVLALRPALVIWQVGANGAMENEDIGAFSTLVVDGIRQMHKAGIDVVLMDNQQSPKILAAPQHGAMNQALADIAAKTGASLFSRAALMDAWQDDGFPYKDFIAADGLHHNDRGYHCLAHAMAQAIVSGLGQSPTSQMEATRGKRIVAAKTGG
jgi:lysophospholipase L1-like esterase